MADGGLPATSPYQPSYTNSATIIKDALVQSLTTADGPQDQMPYGLDIALINVNHGSAVFMKSGPLVWYAWFRASQRDRIIETLTACLPMATLENIAAAASDIIAHDTVRRRVHHIFYASDRARSRLELMQTAIDREPPIDASRVGNGPLQPAAKRVRFSHTDHVVQPSGSTNFAQGTVAPAGLEITSREEPPDGDGTDDEVFSRDNTPQADSTGDVARQQAADQGTEDPGILSPPDSGDNYSNPSARCLMSVFPAYLCTAIVKKEGRASVVVSFQADPAQCCLIFDIIPAEVQHFAKELFDIYIRVRSKQRHIYLDNSAIIKLKGHIELTGTLDAKVRKMIGEVPALAYSESRKRMEEIAQGSLVSSALTMAVWEDDDSPARVTILMQPKHLHAIRKQLWPEPRSPGVAGVLSK